jgi:uncharacterized protein (DUF2236 family)
MPKLHDILVRKIDAQYAERLQASGQPPIDFSQPVGVPALVAPDSVSWRVFKNPLTLFIGGVTAVILELGEAPALPGLVRPLLQPLMVKAALSLVPQSAKIRLGLEDAPQLSRLDLALLKTLAHRADLLALPSSPAAQSCVRMGLPADHLYRQT